MLGSPGARRAYWAIVSQGLDSASNFLLSVWVARSVAPREFGAFGLIYVAITMGAMLSRSAANMPMMISFATSAERFTASLAADVMGTALAVALGLSTLFLIFGLIISGPLHAIALIAAAVTPAVLLQDCVCYLFFARQQAQLAVVNNVVWLGVQGVAFWLATNAGHWHGAWIYLGLWGAAAYVAVGVSIMQLRAWPRLAHVQTWLTSHRSMISDLTVESLLMQGAQQGIVYVLALGVSLVGVAAFRATLVPLGLLRVFFNGLIPIGVSEGALLFERRPESLLRMIRLWAAGGAVLNLAFGFALIAMPLRWGREFLGTSWNHAHPILLWMTLATAANAAIMPVQAGLRSLAATRTAVKLRVPIVALQVAGVLGGVVGDGLRGGAIGYAAGSVLSAVLAHQVFDRTFRGLARVPLPTAAAAQLPWIAPEAAGGEL